MRGGAGQLPASESWADNVFCASELILSFNSDRVYEIRVVRQPHSCKWSNLSSNFIIFIFMFRIELFEIVSSDRHMLRTTIRDCSTDLIAD
jgi:hypothetical protein